MLRRQALLLRPAQHAPVIGRLTWVVSIAADDVWAVGFTGRPTEVSDPLVRHYDGSAWGTVKTPPVDGGSAYLEAVSALSADDVWAVGYYTSGGFNPLIEHWNGKRWKLAAVANHDEGVQLYDVDAVAADDVWAVGWELDLDFDHAPIVYHYDGDSWTPIVDQQADHARGAVFEPREFRAVSADGPDDVWAVGSDNNGQSPLAEHWDGTAWTLSH